MSDSLLLRKSTLAARDTLGDKASKSLMIENNLLKIDEFNRATTYFVYASFRSEVNTLGIIDKLLGEKKRLTVPITHTKIKKIDAIEIFNRSEDLVPGYCDIPEPKERLWQDRKVAPEDIDIIILPGSVFDERCGRFGYGGGYYDRFLERVPKATRIGLAYEMQMIKRAPLQDHDELLDYIVTEKRIITCKRGIEK